MPNSNMIAAKKAKNDEFYTQLVDIENELRSYPEAFRDKTVYCNCDSPESNFVKYFETNFERLGLRKLLTSHLHNGEGDFRSEESIALLREADIVVTNPPFSLFREFVAQLIEYDLVTISADAPVNIGSTARVGKGLIVGSTAVTPATGYVRIAKGLYVGATGTEAADDQIKSAGTIYSVGDTTVGGTLHNTGNNIKLGGGTQYLYRSGVDIYWFDGSSGIKLN